MGSRQDDGNPSVDSPSWRPNPEVIAKRLDKVAVVVHIPTHRIFQLNETGAWVWELLGRGLGVDIIVHRLVDEFDVDRPRAAEEVKDLLVELENAGLLVS